MTDTRTASQALKGLSGEQRKELVRLANRGQQHPDPGVAAAAFAWSHAPTWNRLVHRVPGWILPAAGVALAALCVLGTVALDLPVGFLVFALSGSVVVVALGSLGWMGTSTARTLRDVYPTPPSID